MSIGQIARQPSAWLPLVMSAAAGALILAFLAGLIPPDPEGDEGVGARLFQLLIGLQLPVIGWFLVRWLPQDPPRVATVLLLQVLAAGVVVGLIWRLEHGG